MISHICQPLLSISSSSTPTHTLLHPSSRPSSSLSLTLQHFFTLAGTIHISVNKNYINYTNGDTLPFTVVESNSDFHQLVSSQKHDYISQVYPLFPQLSGLLAIQASVFHNQSICIGVTVQHIAGDGASMACFLKSWASACKSGTLTTTPIYDRGLVPEIPGMYHIIYRVYSQQIQSRPVTSPSKTSFLASSTLPRDLIEVEKQVTEGDGSVSVLTGEDGVLAATVMIEKAVEQLKVGDVEATKQLGTKLAAIAHERKLTVSWSP